MNDVVNKILELVNKPTFIKNEAGTYIACNTSFEKFLGISRAQILGNTAFEIAPVALAKVYTSADKDLFEKHSAQIYRSKVQTTYQKKDVIFSKIIIFNGLDQRTGFIGTVNEIQGGAAKDMQDKGSNGSSPILTKREFEILYLMSQSSSAKGIANALGISRHTVGDHLKMIYLKLNVNSRVGAIIAGQKLGLI